MGGFIREAVRRDGQSTGLRLHSEPLFRSLVSSAPLQRLRAVGFLGAIDHCANFAPGPLYYWRSRFAHSLSVAWLADSFARQFGCKPADTRRLVAAALLHDAGHTPLSHSAETAFIQRFGLDHKTMTEAVILGEVELGRDIPHLLRKNGIEPAEVVELLDDDGDRFPGSAAFRIPLNVDTLDGITRAARYFRLSTTSRSELICALAAMDQGNFDSLDVFWRLKDEVYGRYLSSSICTLLDRSCAQYLIAAELRMDQAFWTDEELLAKYPDLRHYLSCVDLAGQVSEAPISNELTRSKKRYWIEQSEHPSTLSDLRRRYVDAWIEPV